MARRRPRPATSTARNKKVALLIAVIALFLAFSETLGKSAQTAALNYQIEASNLWNFFQAKNIRRTSTHGRQPSRCKLDLPATDRRAAEGGDRPSRSTTGPRPRRATAPSRKRPAARAKAPSSCRGAPSRSSTSAILRWRKYHHYEVASAAFQIGIVLASATVITGMVVLSYLPVGLGVLGLGFMAIGLFAPHAVHLF